MCVFRNSISNRLLILSIVYDSRPPYQPQPSFRPGSRVDYRASVFPGQYEPPAPYGGFPQPKPVADKTHLPSRRRRCAYDASLGKHVSPNRQTSRSRCRDVHAGASGLPNRQSGRQTRMSKVFEFRTFVFANFYVVRFWCV